MYSDLTLNNVSEPGHYMMTISSPIRGPLHLMRFSPGHFCHNKCVSKTEFRG